MEIARVVVIGASAGGVQPLRTLASGLHHRSAAYFVVLHTPPSGRSFLPEILDRAGALRAIQASDGLPIESGTIYVAEPDHHMLIADGHVRSVRGPKENRSRPSVNALFRSAALNFGPKVIGVILSGSLDDGTAGLWEIKGRGGITIVQDPEDAAFDSMPRSAIRDVDADYILPASEIASMLNALIVQAVEANTSPKEEQTVEDPTNLTCPECRGPLRQKLRGRTVELICRVGHAYSPQDAFQASEETQERALWAAVVALEEGADLALRLVDTHPEAARALEHRAAEKRAQASAIEQLIRTAGPPVTLGPD